jgi:hypothetical protein
MSALSDAPGNMNLKRGLSNTVIPIADDPKGMNKARGRWGSMPRTTLNVPRSTWPWLLLALVALGTPAHCGLNNELLLKTYGPFLNNYKGSGKR